MPEEIRRKSAKTLRKERGVTLSDISPDARPDKRERVRALLDDPTWSQWSDRVIAAKCGVSAPLVHSVRRGPTSRRPCVYFIQAHGVDLIKIGTTTNLQRRLEYFRANCPVPVNVLATIPGGHAKERELHIRFAANRRHGEWFEPSAEIMALIASAGPRDE